MLDTKQIWATDIRFLNDSQEHRHALELVEEEANSIDDAGNRRLIVDSVRAFFSTDVFEQSNMQVFVTSFCAEKDLLSQWRAYTEENRGVALGFNLRPLRPARELSSFSSLAPCVYDDKKKRDLVKSVIKGILDELNMVQKELLEVGQRVAFESWNEPPASLEQKVKQRLEVTRQETEPRLEDAIKVAIADLARLMPLLKHESFKEEREWRLAVVMYASEIPDIFNKRTRVGKASLIPFIDIPFVSKNDNKALLTDLIMGPNPAMARSLAAAKIALGWNGFNTVDVNPSSTTFRSW